LHRAYAAPPRRWHPRDDLVGVTLEDDCLAVDEYGLVMALADRPPDNEIPAPDLLVVVFPRSESGVPDVIETYLRNKSINKILLPRPGVFPFLTTRSKVREARRELVESGLVVCARQMLYVLPFLDVTSAQDLSALLAIAPLPAVIHDPADTPGQLDIAEMLALQLSDRRFEIVCVKLATVGRVSFVYQSRARELWGWRRELVQRNQWNLYYIDQGGNDATRRWLTEFRTARHKASRERLEAGKNTWNAWAERTSADHYQAQGGASQRRKIAPADRQLPGPDRPGYSATGLQALADAMSPNGCRRQRIS
jgi:hypothetical protein